MNRREVLKGGTLAAVATAIPLAVEEQVRPRNDLAPCHSGKLTKAFLNAFEQNRRATNAAETRLI